jgi:hypothetical protein
MACPNLAGLALLLRQYVSENFPEIADNHVEVTNMVNRLMMSTADIMINKNGQPYAVRKQGAGLANLLDSINTKAVILTYDENGEAMNTSKLELGDDKAKTGVYEMTFGIKNFGTTALSYDMSAYVLTEGVSKTLTSHGQTTVTQEAYPLEGAVLEIVRIEGGSNNGMNVTVNGGSTANVTVKITLSDADKKYMNDSFENGMFVEGFITLKATAGTDIDMSVPYLAFYGDWTQAPLLDLDYFQTDEDDRNESLLPEDKTMADLWATIPLGAIDDEYMSYLGSFYFFQDPKNIVIAADKEQEQLLLNIAYAFTQQEDLRVVPDGAENEYSSAVWGTLDEVIDDYLYRLEESTQPTETTTAPTTQPQVIQVQAEPESADPIMLICVVCLLAAGVFLVIFVLVILGSHRRTKPRRRSPLTVGSDNKDDN